GRHHDSAVQSDAAGVAHLLDQSARWCDRAARRRPIQEWRRRVLRSGRIPRAHHLRSLPVVEHHCEFGALRASVFHRWRQDLGSELGYRSDAHFALATMRAMFWVGLALFCPVAEAADYRQSRDDAWWTGPILAAGASTLPPGHALIEPYLYNVMSRGRYDDNGTRHDGPRRHSYGSLTYLLY